MKYRECKVDVIDVEVLNKKKAKAVLVDGKVLIVCNEIQSKGVLDFLKQGFHTKLLNSTQKNQLMRVVEEKDGLKLFGLHPITGELLIDDKPIRKERRYEYGYKNVVLMRGEE